MDPAATAAHASLAAAVLAMRRDRPLRFLEARVGDAVLVASPGGGDTWIGEVIHLEGGARCASPSFFQIACVDTGVIRTVNADAVVEILRPSPDA
jgi:hypothetical protein